MVSIQRQPVRVLTVGRIAEIESEPVHRIEYVLRTNPHIRPRARAGRLRIFDEHGLQQIRDELAKGRQQ